MDKTRSIERWTTLWLYFPFQERDFRVSDFTLYDEKSLLTSWHSLYDWLSIRVHDTLLSFSLTLTYHYLTLSFNLFRKCVPLRVSYRTVVQLYRNYHLYSREETVAPRGYCPSNRSIIFQFVPKQSERLVWRILTGWDDSFLGQDDSYRRDDNSLGPSLFKYNSTQKKKNVNRKRQSDSSNSLVCLLWSFTYLSPTSLPTVLLSFPSIPLLGQRVMSSENNIAQLFYHWP